MTTEYTVLLSLPINWHPSKIEAQTYNVYFKNPKGMPEVRNKMREIQALFIKLQEISQVKYLSSLPKSFLESVMEKYQNKDIALQDFKTPKISEPEIIANGEVVENENLNNNQIDSENIREKIKNILLLAQKDELVNEHYAKIIKFLASVTYAEEECKALIPQRIFENLFNGDPEEAELIDLILIEYMVFFVKYFSFLKDL